jgi:hypothetical protein
MAIFFEVSKTSTGLSCYTRPGAYNMFYRIFYLAIYCMLPSFCMGLLCVLTLKNIRQQARRIQPTLIQGSESLRRIDRQMIRMLFSQVLTQLCSVLPFATLSLVALFINTATTIFSFIDQIFILPLFVSYTTSFYIFTLSSRIYRQELMKIIWFWKPGQDQNELTARTIASNPITYRSRKTKTADLQER